jgi:hypothetical protein
MTWASRMAGGDGPDHRSQVCRALTALGITPPATLGERGRRRGEPDGGDACSRRA